MCNYSFNILNAYARGPLTRQDWGHLVSFRHNNNDGGSSKKRSMMFGKVVGFRKNFGKLGPQI